MLEGKLQSTITLFKTTVVCSNVHCSTNRISTLLAEYVKTYPTPENTLVNML